MRTRTRASGTSPPNAWKIVGSLLGILLTIVLLWIGYVHSGLAANDAKIVQVKGEVQQESKERAEERRKSDVATQEIKGKVESIQEDIKRIERSQKDNKDEILNELRRRGRTP